MKQRTRVQKYKDYFDVFKCLKEGRKVKREGAKDGSIVTIPTVLVPDILESQVLKQCLAWLKARGIFANRHDAGTFQNSRGQWATYGIKNAGDIIGILEDGQHFEVECKRGRGGRLSLGQQQRKHDVEANNGVYMVIHGQPELEFYFKHLI